jgi:hypothetical protein
VISSLASLLYQRTVERQKLAQRHDNNAETPDTLSTEVWTHVLEDFLIQLLDQQLLLGLVVLVCAFVVYFRKALGGNNNLWHAADIASFSMFSHAATVLALRTYFRKHKKLAAIRVFLMMSVFALWATVGYYILHPDGPYHKLTPIVRFWQAATYFEFLGIS